MEAIISARRTIAASDSPTTRPMRSGDDVTAPCDDDVTAAVADEDVARRVVNTGVVDRIDTALSTGVVDAANSKRSSCTITPCQSDE